MTQPTPQQPRRARSGQVTSIKVKLGLLVAASVLVAAVLATLGAGAVPAWLSIPVTVLLALGVTQLLAVGMTSPLRQMTEAARRMAAGDYAVRVRHLLDRRGRRAGPRVQHGWPPTWRPSTASAATWWPASRTSCARRWPPWWPCWRTSTTASPSPTRRPSGSRSARPRGWATSSPTCSTCPASTPAWSPLDRSRRAGRRAGGRGGQPRREPARR